MRPLLRVTCRTAQKSPHAAVCTLIDYLATTSMVARVRTCARACMCVRCSSHIWVSLPQCMARESGAVSLEDEEEGWVTVPSTSSLALGISRTPALDESERESNKRGRNAGPVTSKRQLQAGRHDSYKDREGFPCRPDPAACSRAG